jgi:hypothetical protein
MKSAREGPGFLIQAALTWGRTANLAALRTRALSNVMNASSAPLKLRCSPITSSLCPTKRCPPWVNPINLAPAIWLAVYSALA